MALHIGDRFPQRAVGFHQAIRQLLVEPTVQLVHDRTAIGLVVREAHCGAHLPVARLCIMVKPLLERLDDHPTLLWKHVFQIAKLAPAVGQTVAANHLVFVHCIPRERVGHDQRFVQVRLALL
jgi:hypothetical protein